MSEMKKQQRFQTLEGIANALGALSQTASRAEDQEQLLALTGQLRSLHSQGLADEMKSPGAKTRQEFKLIAHDESPSSKSEIDLMQKLAAAAADDWEIQYVTCDLQSRVRWRILLSRKVLA